jgi:hypothetical protein
MNKQETAQVITLLAGNYSSIADKTKEQKQMMLNTWQECLGDLDYKVVLQAVKKSIINSPYPPTIHEIRKNAVEIIKPSNQKSAIEAWNEAHKMICNGLYMTQEEFDKASPEVKKFFGNTRQLQELAKTDSDTINTVTKGQFLKQYEILVKRENERKMLPEKWLNITAQLAEKMSVKQIGE